MPAAYAGRAPVSDVAVLKAWRARRKEAMS
jgi:hypothetical protein